MNEGMEASEHRRKDTGEPAHTAFVPSARSPPRPFDLFTDDSKPPSESVKASISQLADLVNLQTLNQPPVCKPAKTKASRK